MARRLPSLNALRAFEAFARHGRMTLAADELCVTHGAISRQIRQLEDQLGVPLTEGPRSRLRMTEAGLKLAQGLSPAFDQIEAAVPRPPQVGPRPLVVSCLPTFAMKWLIPRLPRFQAAYPDIPVRVMESNEPFDYQSDGVDLAIRMRAMGKVYPEDSVATPFMGHFHGPVMSPELAASIEPTLARIGALPRLHTRTFPESWSEWEHKMPGKLPEPVSEQEFDHYFYLIEAAAAGLGVAVGPWAFVQRDLASGRLVAPLGFVTGDASVVALTPPGEVARAMMAFRDWLVEEGRTTPMPPTSTAPSPEAACDSVTGR